MFLYPWGESLDGKMDAFDGFQINEELVSHAILITIHALPSCTQGEEVTMVLLTQRIV